MTHQCKKLPVTMKMWMQFNVMPRTQNRHVFPLPRELHWLRVPYGLSSVSPYSSTAALTVQRRSISLTGYSELPTSARALGCALCRRHYFTFHGRITNKIGNWAFLVTAAKVWSSLPPSITSLLQFRMALKTELF